MRIPIENVGGVGVIKDLPFEKVPLNAWTDARNMRFRDGAAEKMLGYSESFASPSIAPYWLLPVNTGGTQFWLYGGLTKVGATDGASHADITRSSGGDYSVDANIGWTGAVMNGIPVISNGVDVPQMWNTPALGTPLAALTAWPGTYSARSLRALKRYLVALDIIKGATRYPFMVKWSSAAPAGAVPSSWDETDPTVDAREFELPAGGGFVVDGFPLRDALVLYKEYETWLMQFVGGVDVFRFLRIFSSFGAFNRRCALEFDTGRHLVFTGDDIVLHDSQNNQSILDRRAKALVRGVVDTTHYRKSFVARNPVQREVWVCVPESGNEYPNKAIVWNWVEGTIGLRDLPNAAHIAEGIVNPIEATELWSGAVGDWSTDSASWGDRTFDPSQRAMLMAVPGETKLHLLNSTNQNNGSNMTSYLERVGLGFPLKVERPPDFSTVKLVRGLWPRISGTVGGVINVSVGSQEVANGPVTWETPRPYTIGTSEFIDVLSTGRLHALRFESTTDINWKLHDYDVDVVPIGKY